MLLPGLFLLQEKDPLNIICNLHTPCQGMPCCGMLWHTMDTHSLLVFGRFPNTSVGRCFMFNTARTCFPILGVHTNQLWDSSAKVYGEPYQFAYSLLRPIHSRLFSQTAQHVIPCRSLSTRWGGLQTSRPDYTTSRPDCKTVQNLGRICGGEYVLPKREYVN